MRLHYWLNISPTLAARETATRVWMVGGWGAGWVDQSVRIGWGPVPYKRPSFSHPIPSLTIISQRTDTTQRPQRPHGQNDGSRSSHPDGSSGYGAVRPSSLVGAALSLVRRRGRFVPARAPRSLASVSRRRDPLGAKSSSHNEVVVVVRVTPARVHRLARDSRREFSWRKLRRDVESKVAWLDSHRGTAGTLRWVTSIGTVAIPTVKEFQVITSAWWLFPWFACLALLVPLEFHRHGTSIRQLIGRIGKINGSFGGALDGVTNKIPLQSGCLSEEGSEMETRGLLHRIRDYTAVALGVETKPVLRATIAVPIIARPGDPPRALRIWAYDEPHQTRGYTTLPLYDAYGEMLPGAPSAYLLGSLWIIHDVRTLKLGTTLSVANRPYRSILSVPLSARDADGRPLAVVNVDADEPNFFDPESVVDRVMPLVAPVINAIGLVLRLRLQGVPYDFPR
jgi:hypothetical protein